MTGVIDASEVRVGVLPTTDPAEHLDEDWAIPCDNEDHDQPPPANWILHWACCATDLVCTDCKDQVLAATEMPFVKCDFCGKTYTPALAAIRLIEPLNRRTT